MLKIRIKFDNAYFKLKIAQIKYRFTKTGTNPGALLKKKQKKPQQLKSKDASGITCY